MDQLEFPQSLIIYIKTNIPKHGYITYFPKMSSSASDATNTDANADAVFFTSQVKLSPECLANYLKTQSTEKDANNVFFSSSQFKGLTRFCSTKDVKKPTATNAKTNTEIVTNNLQITLDALFKNGNRLQLDVNKDAPSYVIHSSSFAANSWQMDTKPLYMMPKNMIKVAEKELKAIQQACPDCVSGAQSTTAMGQIKKHVDTMYAAQPEAFPLLSPSVLPFSEEFAVCDIRTFFYLTDSRMAFAPQQLEKYAAALKDLKQTIQSQNKNTNNNEAILTKYKIVFLAILEILNKFYTKIDAAAAADALGDDDDDDSAQLKRTLKQMCRLDMKIYEEFTRLDFNELLAVLLNVSSSISSLDRNMLKEGNTSTTLLAMQSFFAFRKAIVTNDYLVQQHNSNTSFNALLEHKLMAEYCWLLANVYYFQKRFIYVYLDPLLRQYEKDKIADCANNAEIQEKETCEQNTNSTKITVIWMHLFIQAARQNYLTDFCNTSHKPKTLEKKCGKILQLFSGKVLNDTNETHIQRVFERITYTSTSTFMPINVFRLLSTESSNAQPLTNAIQTLMKLYLRLHNKICKSSDASEWTLQGDDLTTDVESLAQTNHINIMVLNQDATQVEHTTVRYNDEMEYFVLVKESASDSYRIAFNYNQVQFELKEDATSEPEEDATELKERVTLGGAK